MQNISLSAMKYYESKSMKTKPDRYRKFGLSRRGAKAKVKDITSNLLTPAAAEKGVNMPHTDVPKKNATHQADLLFLPNDGGYRYALVVVDLATRALDARPLKTKKAVTVLKALMSIYDSGKWLKSPSIMQVDDGTEFKDAFARRMEQLQIGMRVARTGRHRQQAQVESLNGLISKALGHRMLHEELVTDEKAVEWKDDLPELVGVLNERQTRPEKKKYGIPRCKGKSCQLLAVGSRVRVVLDFPKSNTGGQRLHGTFRQGDVRWQKTPRKIKQILLRPDQPPMYLIEGIPNASYTRQQLQVYTGKEAGPSLDAQRNFVVEALTNRRKVKGKVVFTVKWKGHTVLETEPRTALMKHARRLVLEYEKGM